MHRAPKRKLLIVMGCILDKRIENATFAIENATMRSTSVGCKTQCRGDREDQLSGTVLAF